MTLTLNDLHPRMADVAVLVAEGLSNRGIAERLFISESTVKVHITRIRQAFCEAGLLDDHPEFDPRINLRVTIARWVWSQTEGERAA